MNLNLIAKNVSEILKNIGNQLIEEQSMQELGSKISNAELENRFQKVYEKKIKYLLIDEYPEIGFESELTEIRDIEKEWIWVCDPLDGKWSFWNGEVTWVNTISLLHKGKTVFCAINNPLTNELFMCIDGHDATLNGKTLPIHIKRTAENLVVNFMMDRKCVEKVTDLMKLRSDGVLDKLISTGGSLSYALAQLAEGRHSVFIIGKDEKTDFWDQGAGFHILHEVGGKVTDFQGNKLNSFSTVNGFVASSSNLVHNHILPIIKNLGW